MRKKILVTGILIAGGLILSLAIGCATVSTSGDYTLESGETVTGNLLITSGNAMLDEDSRVTGDVIMTSGDLFADGQIDGDIILSSGDVNLGPKAVVKGDIKGTSGNVNRADGARVDGHITTSQSTFTFGSSVVASFFLLCCLVPIIVLVVIIALLVALRRARSPGPTPVSEPKMPTPPEDPALKLKQLKQMLDDGLITEAEYEDKKAEILTGM